MILIEIKKSEIESHINKVAENWTNVTANKTLSAVKKVFDHGLEKMAIIEDIIKDIPFLSEKEHERNNFLLPPQLSDLVSATQNT